MPNPRPVCAPPLKSKWLLATKSNTLVLTEMRPSEGGRHILACLQAEGFTTTCTPGWTDSRY